MMRSICYEASVSIHGGIRELTLFIVLFKTFKRDLTFIEYNLQINNPPVGLQ